MARNSTDLVGHLQVETNVAAECTVTASFDNAFETDDTSPRSDIFLNRCKFSAMGYNPQISWDSWFGVIYAPSEWDKHERFIIRHLRVSESVIQYITPQALKQVQDHAQHFQYGIDLTNLPAGFKLVKSDLNSGMLDALDYDPLLAARKPHPTPLAVNLSPEPNTDTSYAQADGIIAGFNPIQNKWWQALFVNGHAAHNTYEYYNKLELVKQFQYFVTYIRETFNLELYDFDTRADNFSDIKNLSVALGRIIYLLQNCDRIDLTKQFEACKFLNLDSTGAIRAITDYRRSDTPCSFVMPGMQATSDSFIFIERTGQRQQSIGYGFYGDPNKNRLSHECYWRYLAYQPHKYSIDFYQRAEALIDAMPFINRKYDQETEFSIIDSKNPEFYETAFTKRITEEKDILRRVVAQATSGSNHTDKLSEEQALDLVDKMLTTIQNTTLRILFLNMGSVNLHLKLEIILALRRLALIPNLNFTKKITEFFCKFFNRNFLNPFEVRKKMEKIENALNDLLLKSVRAFGTCIFDGFNFYYDLNIDAAEPDDSRLIKYLKFIDKIGFTRIYYTVDDERFCRTPDISIILTLAPLISIFDLLGFLPPNNPAISQTEDQLDEIITEYLGCLRLVNAYQLKFSVSILKLITNRDNLAFGNLRSFIIEDLASLALSGLYFNEIKIEIEILNRIKTRFGSNFAQGLLDSKIAEIQSPILTLTETQATEVANYPRQLQSSLRTFLENFGQAGVSYADLADLRRQAMALIARLKDIVSYNDFEDIISKMSIITVKDHSDGTDPSLDAINSLRVICILGRTNELNQIVCHPSFATATDVTKKLSIYLEYLARVIATSETSLPRLQLQTVLSEILLNSTPGQYADRREYVNILIGGDSIVSSLSEIALTHHSAKVYLLESLRYLDKREDPDNYIKRLRYFSMRLRDVFNLVSKENSEHVYSIMYHLHKSPAKLLEIFKLLAINLADAYDKQPNNKTKDESLIIIISKLLDNSKSIEGLERFISLCDNAETLEKVLLHYQRPPYADIPTINIWLSDLASFDTHNTEFSLLPHGERKTEYAFDSDIFDTQKLKFSESTQLLLNDDIKAIFKDKIAINGRKLTGLTCEELTQELERILISHESSSNTYKAKAIAVLIEILARTTSQKDPKSGDIISQELNTTQIMALCGIVLSGSDTLIAGIATGEGKSRIMMILAAYNCLMGSRTTVDVVTSNMQLAARDYSIYKAFFRALNIETGLIYSSSEASAYKKQGVNFSDAAQLSLARNCSTAKDRPLDFAVKHEDQTLLLDECDVAYFDAIQNRFNFADHNPLLANATWIYKHLVEFVADQSPDFQRLTEFTRQNYMAFYRHLQEHDTDEGHISLVEKLSSDEAGQKQLATWFQSAITASKMQEDVHFKTSSAELDKLVPVVTPSGIIYSRSVYVISNQRIAMGSTYANGVHQCLCARLNIAARRADPSLLTNPFFISPEKNITYSSTSKSLLDTYSRIYGVTGTPGSAHERTEMLKKYKMAVVDVPRHSGLQRIDRKIILAAGEQQHFEYLYNQISAATAADRPVLVICKNDEQSKRFSDYLKSHLGLTEKLQLVDASTSSEDEEAAITKAGQPGIVTVSTSMLGRGTDINSDNMLVLGTYVPSKREMWQFFGRAGRFGRRGETRLIVDNTLEQLPVTYAHDIEADLRQTEQELTTRKLRALSEFMSGFMDHLHNQFFKHGTGIIDLLKAQWQAFLNDTDRAWALLSHDLAAYNLGAFTDEDSSVAQKLLEFLASIENKFNLDLFAEIQKQNQRVEFTRYFMNSHQAITKHFNEYLHDATTSRLLIPVQSSYDPANVGQANIYGYPFAETIAMFTGERPLFANTRAWLNGTGVLFADTRAILSGERPIFANTRAFIETHNLGPLVCVIATICVGAATAIILCVTGLAPIIIIGASVGAIVGTAGVTTAIKFLAPSVLNRGVATPIPTVASTTKADAIQPDEIQIPLEEFAAPSQTCIAQPH